jgi:predicted  nucleic acid-binding Zn-ribbon protein
MEPEDVFLYIVGKGRSMSYGETVNLEFLSRQQSQLLEEIRGLRQESRDVRKSFVGVSEHFSRQERRLTDLREDLESIIKLELGGAVANLETRIENYLERRLDEHSQQIDAALGNMDRKLDVILQKLDGASQP